MITLPLLRDVPEALEHLDNLGSTDAIAKYLTEIGIKATPGECGQCAVAVFLTETVRILEGVWVNPGAAGGDVEECPEVGAVRSTPLPASVNAFAMLFDIGRYPELVVQNT